MTLAERIIADRKSRGFSQEELAEQAKVSLRTIQRIEKGETVPRGYTLQALAGALNRSVEEFAALVDEPATSDRNESIKAETTEEIAAYVQLINLSALTYLVFPYLNVILPIVLWRRKKHVPEISQVARKIINFQVLWTVALHVAIMLMLLFQVLMAYYLKTKTGVGILAVFFIMYLLNAPAIILASAKLKKGNYNIYPFGLRIF